MTALVLLLRSAARSAPQVFADVSDDPSSATEDWRRFGSRAQLESYARDGHASSQGLFWRQANAVFVKMSFAPQSGDWVHAVEYCFSSNGRLLRAEARLETSHGFDPATGTVVAVSRVRTSYFASDGRVLRTTTRVLDGTTGRPAPALQYLDDDEPIFKTLSALPFVSLVK